MVDTRFRSLWNWPSTPPLSWIFCHSGFNVHQMIIWRICLHGDNLNISPVRAPLYQHLNSPMKIKKHLCSKNPIVSNSKKIWKRVVTTLKAPGASCTKRNAKKRAYPSFWRWDVQSFFSQNKYVVLHVKSQTGVHTFLHLFVCWRNWLCQEI